MATRSIFFDKKTFSVEKDILSLDATCFGHTVFMSTLDSLLFKSEYPKQQILLSEEAYQVALRKNLDLAYLPLVYSRPIALGPLSVQLLQCSSELGNSALHATLNDDSILYLSKWNEPQKYLNQLIQANKLIVRTHESFFETHLGMHKETCQEIVQYASAVTQAGEKLVLVVSGLKDLIPLFKEIIANNIPVECDQTSSQLLHGYVAGQSPKPTWNIPQQHHKEAHFHGVLIVCKEMLLKQRPKRIEQGIWCWVGSEFEKSQYNTWLRHIPFTHHFQWRQSAMNIEKLLSHTNAKQIYVSGPNWKLFSDVAKKMNLECFLIQTSLQDSLF